MEGFLKAYHDTHHEYETKEDDGLTMLFLEIKINGYNARALIDCGASHNFIFEDFIR